MGADMKPRTLAGCAACLSLIAIILSATPSPLLAQVQVTSANPNMAAEGTINLNVIVGGNGFKKGAKAAWLQSGTTNPGDVTVNSTSVNSSSQVTANITVSASGFTGSYDIVVTNTDGRSGKGTQLFSVTSGGGKTSASCSGNSGLSFNVTSIVADRDANNLPFQLQSDTLGPYTSYMNNKNDQVVSEIQASSCDWLLDLSHSQSRTVALTFSTTDQASGSASPPFTGTQQVSARIISICAQNSLNNGVSFGTMTYAGQTLQCGVDAAFAYNGNQYHLQMMPNHDAGTDWVQVTCTGAISNVCNAWTVTPIPNMVTNASTGQSSSVGELLQFTLKGTQTSLGLYYVAFYVTAHD